jgi:hypothetical protein
VSADQDSRGIAAQRLCREIAAGQVETGEFAEPDLHSSMATKASARATRKWIVVGW